MSFKTFPPTHFIVMFTAYVLSVKIIHCKNWRRVSKLHARCFLAARKLSKSLPYNHNHTAHPPITFKCLRGSWYSSVIHHWNRQLKHYLFPLRKYRVNKGHKLPLLSVLGLRVFLVLNERYIFLESSGQGQCISLNLTFRVNIWGYFIFYPNSHKQGLIYYFQYHETSVISFKNCQERLMHLTTFRVNISFILFKLS